MLSVLYDNQIFGIQKFGGISRYFSELMKGLNNRSDTSSIPKSFHTENKHLQLSGLAYRNRLLENYNFKGKAKIRKHLLKRQNRKMAKLIAAGNYDIFHPTYYDGEVVRRLPPGKPLVVTVYDMIHELYYNDKFEKIYSETFAKREMLPRADHIIAISQSTKNDIIKFFPDINPEKISVVYLGSSLMPSQKTVVPANDRDYVLFVGNRGYYKNFLWFISAIAPYLKESGTMLKCAGGGKFSDYEMAFLKELEVGNFVNYTDITNDDDLAAIYQNARCFVFPSLYEGFGIPVLEAFSCSCPVILPDNSCFPEIAGEAALYYEPGNALSLIAQVTRIYAEEETAQKLRESGHERLKLFSWEKTVSRHIEIYRAVVGQS